MASKDDVDKVVAALNGAEVGGREIRVLESVPQDRKQKKYGKAKW